MLLAQQATGSRVTPTSSCLDTPFSIQTNTPCNFQRKRSPQGDSLPSANTPFGSSLAWLEIICSSNVSKAEESKLAKGVVPKFAHVEPHSHPHSEA